MNALNEKHVYDLSELTSEELKEVFKELKTEYSWRNVEFNYWSELDNLKENVLLFNKKNTWVMCEFHTDFEIQNAKELFYTLENIQVDVLNCTQEEIKTVMDIYKLNNVKYVRRNYKGGNDSHSFLMSYNNSTNEYPTITYEKFIELFGNKEKFKEFNNLENVQVDCSRLTHEQIKEMADVFESNGYNNSIGLNVCDTYFLLRQRYNKEDRTFGVLGDHKDGRFTTITYGKFMELFGNKENLTLENVYIRPIYVNEAEVERFAKIAPPDIFKKHDDKIKITYEKFMELFDNDPVNHEVKELTNKKVEITPREVIEFLVNKKVFLSPEDYKKLFD